MRRVVEVAAMSMSVYADNVVAEMSILSICVDLGGVAHLFFHPFSMYADAK